MLQRQQKDGGDGKPKRKRLRPTVSCDRCRKIKRSCSRQSPCQRCIKDGQTCTWDGAIETHNERKKRNFILANATAAATAARGTYAGDNEAHHDQVSRFERPSHPHQYSPRNPITAEPAREGGTTKAKVAQSPHSIYSVSPASFKGSPSTTNPSSVQTTHSPSHGLVTQSPSHGLFTPAAPASTTSTATTTLNRGKERETVHAKEDRETDAIWSILSIPSFIKQIVDLYTREIDWIWDIIGGSRLEKLVGMHDDCASHNPHIWQEVKVFAMAIVAITAQLCPTDVEAILVCLDMQRQRSSLAHVRHFTAKSMADAAYRASTENIEAVAKREPPVAIYLRLNKHVWSSEVFAASFLLRMMEKNDGDVRKMGEGAAVDVARLHHVGYMHLPCRPMEIIKMDYMMLDSGYRQEDWPVEHFMLAHNTFWGYYTMDRLSNVVGGTTYMIQTNHADICLNDVFGHTHIHNLENVMSHLNVDRPPVSNAAYCIAPTEHHRRQEAYSGAKNRLSAIISHFTDRMIETRRPAFRWPMDAEHVVRDLDKALENFASYVLPAVNDPRDRMSKAKELNLVLTMELLRTSVAANIHTTFAERLFQRSLENSPISAISRKSIAWQLQKYKLDSAKALIARVLPYSQAALGLRCGWTYYATSIYGQVMEILRAMDDEGIKVLKDKTPSLSRCQKVQLLDYLEYAIKGRNFLVLFGRNKDLRSTTFYVEDVCDTMAGVLSQLGVGEEEPGAMLSQVLDRRGVVDSCTVIQSITQKCSVPNGVPTGPPRLGPAPCDNDLAAGTVTAGPSAMTPSASAPLHFTSQQQEPNHQHFPPYYQHSSRNHPHQPHHSYAHYHQQQPAQQPHFDSDSQEYHQQQQREAQQPLPPSLTTAASIPYPDDAWNNIFNDLAELERLFIIPGTESADQNRVFSTQGL